MTTQRIAAPGIYDIPMDLYHGDTCVGPSVSGSGLAKIERYCPARFFAESYLNPARIPQRDTDAMALGRAAHKLLLEGDAAFSQEWAVEPEGADRRTKPAKEWLAEREALGIGVVRYADYMRIKAMADAVRAHPMASQALTDGAAERSLIWRDDETGVWLKARPDWLPNAHRFIPNYKTTDCAKPEVWRAQAFNLGYHMGAALTIDGARAVLGRKDAGAYFIVQEKEPPYLVVIAVMPDEAIAWGRMQNRRALRLFTECLNRGEWPGYADDVVTVEMPAWAEKQLERRSEAGDFTIRERVTLAESMARFHAPLEQQGA